MQAYGQRVQAISRKLQEAELEAQKRFGTTQQKVVQSLVPTFQSYARENGVGMVVDPRAAPFCSSIPRGTQRKQWLLASSEFRFHFAHRMTRVCSRGGREPGPDARSGPRHKKDAEMAATSAGWKQGHAESFTVTHHLLHDLRKLRHHRIPHRGTAQERRRQGLYARQRRQPIVARPLSQQREAGEKGAIAASAKPNWEPSPDSQLPISSSSKRFKRAASWSRFSA